MTPQYPAVGMAPSGANCATSATSHLSNIRQASAALFLLINSGLVAMATGDDAQSGQFEPIAVYTFPGIEKDRNIEWKGQGHFGNGRIMIGQEVVPRTELLGQGTKLVPAGQIVRVGSMEIRFTDC
jgi:hypothetical protein